MDEKVLNEMQNSRERVDLSPLGIPSDQPKKEMTPEERKKAMKVVMEQYKKMYLKKYNIEGIDLEAELKLINEKKSSLSRSRRDAVVGYFMVFPAAEANLDKVNEKEIEDIGTPATEEDLAKAVTVGDTKEEVKDDNKGTESAE